MSIIPPVKMGLLLRKREILLPTGLGWLCLVAGLMLVMLVSVRSLYSFLAVNDPVHGGVLVVEGWMPEYGYDEVVRETRRHVYREVLVTGWAPGYGNDALAGRTYADLGVEILLAKGLDRRIVHPVPSSRVLRDRTFTAAIALKSWLDAHGVQGGSYHIMTMGAHARRTRLLYERALGEGARIGITPIADLEFDASHWWASSAGFRTVIGELIAYVYARFLFASPSYSMPLEPGRN